MANENNLIPISERTPSELREMRHNGGKKSGETRRRKKAMREAMKDLLSMPVVNMEVYNQTEMMGIDPENIDNQTAVLCRLILSAQCGDVSAAREIRSIIGEDNEAARIKMQKEELKYKKQKYGVDDEEESGVQIVIAPRGGNDED